MKTNIVYILKCINQHYYTGWTNDFIKRMKAHKNGKAAHYTHAFPPVEIIYIEVFESKSEAMRKEAFIKRMTRVQKEQMIQQHKSLTLRFLKDNPFTFFEDE